MKKKKSNKKAIFSSVDVMKIKSIELLVLRDWKKTEMLQMQHMMPPASSSRKGKKKSLQDIS